MPLIRLWAMGLAMAIVGCGSAPSQEAHQVRAVVEETYAPYVREDPDAGASAPWSDDLAAKRAEVEERFMRTMNAWGLEYDPIVNSQESFAANVRVGAPVFGEDGSATVRVWYNNGGREDEVQDFVLIRQHGEWRISDIRAGESSYADEVDEAVAQGRAYEACMQGRPEAEC